MMAWDKCAYCFGYPRRKFFSSYVLHILEKEPSETKAPIFCNERCMLRWAAIKTNRPLAEVKFDFVRFCREEG